MRKEITKSYLTRVVYLTINKVLKAPNLTVQCKYLR